MKRVLFYAVFPLTFAMLIFADILRDVLEWCIHKFNSFEAWSMGIEMCVEDEGAQLETERYKGHEGSTVEHTAQ